MGAERAEKAGEQEKKKLKNEKIKRKYSTLTRRRTVDAGKEKKTTMQAKMRQKKCLSKFFATCTRKQSRQCEGGRGVGVGGEGNVECR